MSKGPVYTQCPDSVGLTVFPVVSIFFFCLPLIEAFKYVFTICSMI